MQRNDRMRTTQIGGSMLTSWSIMIFALAGCQSSKDSVPVPYHISDQGLVDRAIQIYSGNGRVSNEAAMREVYPVVVHLPEMSCVGLNLKPGIAGGDTTICFRKSDGKIAVNHVNGE